jgi:hypothetical protein
VKLLTEAATAGVEAPLMVAWELTREGKEKGKERRAWGAAWEGEAKGGRLDKGDALGLLCTWASLFCA